jgi:ABC-type nitrate/sulfonate/bicarbonate transport system permease component
VGFRAVFSIVVLIVAWEGLARSGQFTPFVLPSLSSVIERIWADAISGDLAINTGLTVYRAMVGFLISMVGGILIGACDVAECHRQLVLRSDRLGRLPDAEDRLPAGGDPVARRL